jgi:hypothetical protein
MLGNHKVGHHSIRTSPRRTILFVHYFHKHTLLQKLKNQECSELSDIISLFTSQNALQTTPKTYKNGGKQYKDEFVRAASQ